MAIPIVVLRGDQTGQELLDQALRVLVPDVVGVDLDLVPFDLSLDSRRATRNAVVYDAVLAMTTRISRRICRVVAEFAFAHASRMHAKVFGGPTYTLSDLVLQMFGSIAGAESLVLALDDRYAVRTVIAEAPHGTAPRLFGKNIANPMAMMLSSRGPRPEAAVLSPRA